MTNEARERRAKRHEAHKTAQIGKFTRWFFNWTGAELPEYPDYETRCKLMRAARKTIQDPAPRIMPDLPALSFLNGKVSPSCAPDRKNSPGLSYEQIQALAENETFVPTPKPEPPQEPIAA